MKKIFFALFLIVSVTLPISNASAGIVDIFVSPGNDVTTGRYWGYFGSGSWTDPNANPNTVYHSYYPGDGNASNAYLIFSLPSLPDFSEILSVSLNIDILNIWTEGRNEVASVSGTTEQVLVSEGTGWQNYDITTDFLARAPGNSSIRYDLTYTGYSGMHFGSAEGQDPAFLRITTAGANAVPVPSTIILLISGLMGLAGFSRKK